LLHAAHLSPAHYKPTWAGNYAIAAIRMEYLHDGGKMLRLQELFGYSDPELVRCYAKFMKADIALDHEIASPADKRRL
jgi:hypothetical protein